MYYELRVVSYCKRGLEARQHNYNENNTEMHNRKTMLTYSKSGPCPALLCIYPIGTTFLLSYMTGVDGSISIL